MNAYINFWKKRMEASFFNFNFLRERKKIFQTKKCFSYEISFNISLPRKWKRLSSFVEASQNPKTSNLVSLPCLLQHYYHDKIKFFNYRTAQNSFNCEFICKHKFKVDLFPHPHHYFVQCMFTWYLIACYLNKLVYFPFNRKIKVLIPFSSTM